MAEWEDTVFLRSPDQYTRDLDVVKNAVETAAQYLHIQTGKPLEQCIKFVKRTTDKGGKYELKPRTLQVLRRLKNGDRAKDEVSIDYLLNGVMKTGSILTPNMVVYDNPDKNKSCTATYIESNKKKRNTIKHKGMIAKQEGDLETFAICNNAEYDTKVLNNSSSGSKCSPHNVFYNPTAHSAMTSTCRIAASYSNTTTERLISGNRHYFNYEIVIENITTICRNTDFVTFRYIVDKYSLYIPTVDEVMDVILRSIYFYWSSKTLIAKIKVLVSKLTDMQRAAVVYTGDLYHLMKFNDSLFRTIISELIRRPENKIDFDYKEYAKYIDADTVALVGIFCADFLAGKSVQSMRAQSEENYITYVNTVRQVKETMTLYADLWVCFFRTDNLPPAIYDFPTSIRRAVIGGDTDSTMFTVQDAIKWYYGKMEFGLEPNRLIAAFIYLDSQVVAHCLAFASKQIGVKDTMLYNLKMKNEFMFPIYIRTNIAKHYAALKSAREGNVFAEYETEIKGVQLKNSKHPPFIMDRVETELNLLMTELSEGKKIKLTHLLQRIANLEHVIINSLTAGKIEFLTVINVQPKDSYKKPMSAAYAHYDLWTKVFSKMYGEIDPPPYTGIKIATTLENKVKLNAWIDSLPQHVRTDMRIWLDNNYIEPEPEKEFEEEDEEEDISEDEEVFTAKETMHEEVALPKPKTKFLSIVVPKEIFGNGLPKELIPIINVRKLTFELMTGFYLILEMFARYEKNKKQTILISDYTPYDTSEVNLPGER